MSTWTPWMDNPLAAAYAVAAERGIGREAIDAVLLRIGDWNSFDQQSFLDDLLQEIAGNTNIVVQYNDEAQYRAALDDSGTDSTSTETQK